MLVNGGNAIVYEFAETVAPFAHFDFVHPSLIINEHADDRSSVRAHDLHTFRGKKTMKR